MHAWPPQPAPSLAAARTVLTPTSTQPGPTQSPIPTTKMASAQSQLTVTGWRPGAPHG